jgi:hypothetical protein
LPYEEGQAVPEGYYVKSRPRVGMVAGGAGALGGLWLAGVVIALFDGLSDGLRSIDCIDSCPTSRDQELGWLAMPVVGPWVSLGTGTLDTGWVAGSIVMGLGQGAGLGLIIAGVAAREKRLVPMTSVTRGTYGENITTLGLRGSF